MNRSGNERRRFLKNGLAMPGLAVGGSASGAANPTLERIDELHQYGEFSEITDIRKRKCRQGLCP